MSTTPILTFKAGICELDVSFVFYYLHYSY